MVFKEGGSRLALVVLTLVSIAAGDECPNRLSLSFDPR